MPNSDSDLVRARGPAPGTDQDSPTEQAGTDVDFGQFLPLGADPLDRRQVLTRHPDYNLPHPPEQGRNEYETGHRPYGRENWEALPIFQRAAKNGRVRVVGVNANMEGGTAIACNQVPGRQAVILSVPTKLGDGSTTPAGVTWAFSQGDLQGVSNLDAGVLNVGDSITIECEAQIWLGLISGQTQGFCQVVELLNPPAGPGVQ